MGAYLQLHLGPYLLIKNKETKKTIEHHRCGTKGCQNKKVEQRTPFCPYCAAEIQTTYSVQKELESPRDCIETFYDDQREFYNQFYVPHAGGHDLDDDYTVLIAHAFGMNVDAQIGNAIEITPQEAEAGIHALNKSYGNLIQYLNRQEFETEVKHGLIVHYS